MTTFPSSPEPLAPHLCTGQDGESVAREFLKRIGYTVIGCNVRIGRDEIDIIAFDPKDKVIVFVEVRTRTNLHPAFVPEKTATWAKRKKLQRSARRWVARRDYQGGYRIDLVCVEGPRVRAHFKELAWDNRR